MSKEEYYINLTRISNLRSKISYHNTYNLYESIINIYITPCHFYIYPDLWVSYCIVKTFFVIKCIV